MNKSIKEMLAELQENNLTGVAVDLTYCEYYTGLRQNTFCIVDTEKKFMKDKFNSLCIAEDGKLIENNIRVAYKHMIAQKMFFPHIL